MCVYYSILDARAEVFTGLRRAVAQVEKKS
jgi:hypothetical protein